MSTNDAELKVGVDASGVDLGMRQAANAVQSGVARMQTHVEGLAVAFGRINLVMAGVAAGVTLLVKSGIDAADDMNDLSQKIGIGVDRLAGYKLAAESSGTSLEGMAGAAKKLSVYIAEHGDKLRAAGFTAKDVDGVMRELADRFQRMPDGAQKTAIAMELMGRSGADMIPLLNGGGASLQELIEKGKQLYPVTAEMARQADAFNDQLAQLEASVSGVSIRIGSALLPKLNDLAQFTQRAIDRFGALGGLLVGVLGGGALQAIGVELNETKRAENEVADAFAKLARARSDLSAAEQSGSARASDIKAFKAEVTAAQRELKAAIKERDALVARDAAAVQRPPQPSAKDRGISSLLGGKAPGSDGDGRADKTPSAMGTYEAVLAEQRRALAEGETYRELGRDAERQYWRDILATYRVGAKDEEQIVRKIAALSVSIAQESAAQKRGLKREEIDETERAALAELETDKQAAQHKLNMGALTADQLLQQHARFEERRYEIQASAQAERIAMLQMDPNADPVALQAQQDKLLELTRQYQVKRQQIVHEEAEQGMQVWQDLGNRMSGLWDKGVEAMMNGTLRWRNALRAIGTELVGWFAKTVIKNMVSQWVTGESLKTTATLAGTMTRWAAESWAAAKSVALWAATAIKNIMSSAWEAMAGVIKAWAGTGPWGWAIGLGMGAAAFAGVAALAGNVRSAEGGFDIPAGLNPMTQLHEEEMVLPAHIANPMREMLAGGGGAGQPINVSISAVDARSVKQLFMDHGPALADALRKQSRNFSQGR